MITVGLNIDKSDGEPDILVDFDTDIEKPVKAQTWTPALQCYVECTEIFLELYRTKGFYHEKVHAAVGEYYRNKSENVEFDEVGT